MTNVFKELSKHRFELSTQIGPHRAAFRELNLAWIEKYFRVEKKDIEQTNNPEQCVRDGGQVFFLVIDGQAVATCAMYKINEGYFELAKMAVRPDFQGQGLGDVLMIESEKWVRDQGGREILILSNTVLEPAIRLYKKHGFEVVHLGPHPDYERANIELKKLL